MPADDVDTRPDTPSPGPDTTREQPLSEQEVLQHLQEDTPAFPAEQPERAEPAAQQAVDQAGDRAPDTAGFLSRYPELGVVEEPKMPPGRSIGRNETVQLTEEQGRQTRTEGLFDHVVHGERVNPNATGEDRHGVNTYLWTIDDRGIHIALESTPFDTDRGHIVHSNLSEQAAIAGEAWFGPGDTVVLNPGSGRFGDGGAAEPRAETNFSTAEWGAAVRAWTDLGYTVVPTLPYLR